MGWGVGVCSLLWVLFRRVRGVDDALRGTDLGGEEGGDEDWGVV